MNESTDTLTRFLVARYADDEDIARLAQREIEERGHDINFDVASSAVFNPARILAECEAKRQIVGYAASWGYYGADSSPTTARALQDVLRLLALPYADHAAFRPEWRP